MIRNSVLLLLSAILCVPADGQTPVGSTDSDKIAIQLPAMWEYSAPLIQAERRAVMPSRAQKDPTIVFHDGQWHVFMTVKLSGRSAIEYCSFADWENANSARRTLLPVSDSDYFCAAQVFYYRPHHLWYLVYQMAVPEAKHMWVAYSTTRTISDPQSWTRAKPMLDGGAADSRQVGGLDYWIICDDQSAYLFFTSLNGKMWRMSTALQNFPNGFNDCQIALRGEIFEASHTYKLLHHNKYITVIEQKGRRHMKAYIADRLDGSWRPLADTEAAPFAGRTNIRPADGVTAWTDNVSHGELVRSSNDERLVVDPVNLRFVFQGMQQADKNRKEYGDFNWRIGMLSAVDGR